MAWLHATPKPAPGSRQAERAAGAGASLPVSRLEALRADGVTPPMPPVPMPHILDRLYEIGLVEAGGMAAAPLSWREIEAFTAATGIRLSCWEARLIHRLSTEYVAEIRRAEVDGCPPPWAAGVTVRERDADEARLRASPFG